MNTGKVESYVLFGLLCGAFLLVPHRLRAQAAPGPLPPPSGSQSQSEPQPLARRAAPRPQAPAPPPRTTLAGLWKWNKDQSDDARQKVRAAEGYPDINDPDPGGYPGGGYPGGGYPGGGYPGGGYPGGGYPGGGYPGGGYPRRGGGPGYGGRDIENDPKLQPLLRAPGLLDVELKDQEIDVTEDQYHKLALYTDGRQLPKKIDDNRPEIAAHWDGNHLVSDEKSPLGGKMSRVYELSGDGRQLYETLHIDNGRSGTPITIKYVYDIPRSDADAHIQNPEDSDPDRPTLKRRQEDDGSLPPPQ